jgi:hypothetical protein
MIPNVGTVKRILAYFQGLFLPPHPEYLQSLRVVHSARGIALLPGRSEVTRFAVTDFLVKVWTSLSMSKPLPDDDGSFVVSVVVDGKVNHPRSQANVTCLLRS